MKQNVRFGVVGCGGISRLAHMPGIAATANAEIVALADPNEENLKSAAEAFGASGLYSSIEEMLKDAEVDAVVIATPVWLHHSNVLAAAAAGKHVICEKPLARTAVEALEMVQACADAGVTLTVMHQQRYLPGFQRIKQLIDEGAIGEIVSLRARSGHAGPDKRMAVPGSGMGSWVFDPAKSGGGALMDIGVHLVDALTWLAGPVESVLGDSATLTRDVPVEDHSFLLLRFASGVVGEADISWSQVAGRNSMEIYGSEGTLIFDRSSNVLSVFSERVNSDGWVEEKFEATDWWLWHRYVIEDFVKAVSGGTNNAPSGDEALHTMQIVDASYRSSKEGRRVRLDSNSEA